MNQARGPRRAFSIIAAVAVIALAAGCGSSSGSSSNKNTSTSLPTLNSGTNYGDTFVASLDPATLPDSLSIDNVSLIQGNLVQTEYPSLKTVAQLASHWTVSPDKKTWTFYIKPNARFSNGDPVTAQDAKWSMTRSLLPATKSTVALLYMHDIVGATAVNKGKSTDLTGVKVINSKTLQIKLDKPIAYFLGTLSYPTSDILDKKVVGSHTTGQITNTCSLNVGAGPFKLVCRNNSSGKSSFYPAGHSPFLDYVPNPYYAGPKPKFKIHAPFFSSSDQDFKAWEDKQISWAPVPVADIAIAQAKPGFQKVPQLETDYITPNSQAPPFNNVHCRLAIAYAINRPQVTTQILHGTESPLYDVVPPGLQGYFGSPSGVPHYDPARARKELSQCPGGIHNVTMPFQGAVSLDITHEYDTIAQNIAAIGASINLKSLTFNAWLPFVTTSMQSTHTKITENLWIDDYPDSQDWLFNLLHTGAQDNIGGYNNPTFDHLVDLGDTEFNPAKRAADYSKAMKIVLNDGGWISVGYATNPVIVNPCIKGMSYYSNTIWPINTDWSKVSITC